jgi:hypothetical protein
MPDLTKLVSNRLSNATAVGAALQVHGAAGAQALSKRLFPHGEPKHLTTEGFIAALGKALEAAANGIADADLALSAEYADDKQYRDARDAARGEVRATILDIQSSVQGAYGEKVLHAYQLDGALPVDDSLLLQLARAIHAKLAGGAPAAAPKKGRKIDFAALAEELDAHVRAFAQGLKDVKREEREAQQALTRRDAAIADYDPVYSGAAQIVAGLLELIGQSTLADQVKPTARRRAGLEAAPGDAGSTPSTTTSGNGGGTTGSKE